LELNMNTTQTQKGENLVSIKINVVKDDYEPQVKQELNKLRRKAAVPGFRPGMAPMGMIKKMYGPQATIEVLNELVSKTLNDYIIENKLDVMFYPLPDPDQKPVDFEQNDNIDFCFEAAIRPQVSIDYTKSPIEFTRVIADDKVIDETIENMTKRNPDITHPETVGENDYLEMKVRQAENGQEVEDGYSNDGIYLRLNEITDEATKKQFIGQELGAEFIINFATALGSETKVTQVIGKDAPTNSDYNIIIDDIRHEETPQLNEDFFKKIYPDSEITELDTFRAKVKEDIEKQYVTETDRILFNKMIDNLIENNPFNLPDEFMKRCIVENNQGKLTAEDVEKNYETNYSKGLRWQIIEDSIVKDNTDLIVKDEEVRGFIRSQIFPGINEANLDDQTKAQLEKIVDNYLKNEEQVNNIKNNIADIKMTNFLKTKMDVHYTDRTYDEFIKLLEEENKNS